MKTFPILVVLALVVGCVNRPGWPERDGARWLERAGYDEETIARVVQGRPLEEELIRDLARSGSQDVGFLLARNPSLSAAWMKKLSTHRKDFVRAGLARNPAITDELVEVLRNDESHTVWVGLAANPSLDARTLLEIKTEKTLDWSWFAMNPACPPEIEEKIRQANDEKGIYWLNRTKKSLRGWPIEKSLR